MVGYPKAVSYLVALALAACSTDSPLTKATRGEGARVYVCDSEALCDGTTEEWCWDGTLDELESMLGASCHSIGPDERFWPWLAGCRYGCPLPGDGRGCNAHCGCFCPPAP